MKYGKDLDRELPPVFAWIIAVLVGLICVVGLVAVLGGLALLVLEIIQLFLGIA